MKKFYKKRLFFYLNIFFALSIWFCIDTNFDNTFEILNNYASWKDDNRYQKLFLFFRSLGPFLVFLIFFFSFIFFKKKINFLTKNKNLNYILIILYVCFLYKCVGLLISDNHIYNSYYIIVALLSIFLITNIYNEDLIKINYFVSLIVLSIVISIYGFLAYKWFFTTLQLNMYGTFPVAFFSVADFSSNIIRSSGLSRSSMIVLIPLFFLILTDKNKFLYLIPYLILSTLIYLSQSRIVVTFFILFSFFSVFYFLRDQKKKYILQKFFILILLPIIFFNALVLTKKEFNKKQFESLGLEYKEEHYKVLRPMTITGSTTYDTNFTSFRYDNQKKMILKSEKPILGYGPLADRFLIDKNAHNTLVYSYVSGGIVSTILMIILIIRYTYLCLFLTFIKKITLQKKNIFILSSIFTISFLFFRGIAEIGIAVFSIDLLVFLSCMAICEKFNIQK